MRPSRAAPIASAPRCRTSTRRFGGGFDIVVGTHEHWDHLSGFLHAQDLFRPGAAAALWCAWTEDLGDPLARSLLASRELGVAALWDTVRRLTEHQAYGARPANGDPPRDWDGVIGFFGESPGIGPKAKAGGRGDAQAARPGGQVTYPRRASRPSTPPATTGAIFVLGPPRDPAALKQADPRRGAAKPIRSRSPSWRWWTWRRPACRRRSTRRTSRPSTAATRSGWRRARMSRSSATTTGRMRKPGMRRRGWTPGQAWRRIGFAWLDGAEALALKLDRITNNTSLVLALEIGPAAAQDNPVLLFAADAQIGNWLSSAGWPGRTTTAARSPAPTCCGGPWSTRSATTPATTRR